jgi:hypothetical protein
VLPEANNCPSGSFQSVPFTASLSDLPKWWSRGGNVEGGERRKERREERERGGRRKEEYLKHSF